MISDPYRKLKSLKGNPTALAFSLDNSELAISLKNDLQIYNLDKQNELKYESKEGKSITIIRYLSKKTFITGNKEGDIIFWTPSGNSLKTYNFKKSHEHPITMISIDEKEEIFASGDSKGKICLWDINSKSLLGKVDNKKENEILGKIDNKKENKIEEEILNLNVRFFKNDKAQKKCIVGNSKCDFFYWNAQSLSEKIEPFNPFNLNMSNDPNKKSDVQAYDFDLSPDEKTLAISLLDGRIAIWSLEKNEMISVFNFFINEAENDKGKVEIKFKSGNSKIIIAREKEWIKEIKIEPDNAVFENINCMKHLTNNGKIISLDQELSKTITVYDDLTGKKMADLNMMINDFPQVIHNCFLSIDHRFLLLIIIKIMLFGTCLKEN